MALGICTFVLVAMMGLFSTGLRAGRESEEQVQAANLASEILAKRSASLTNNLADFAIPASALTNAYGDILGSAGTLIGADGRTNVTADNATCRLVCRAGTNAFTGPRFAQVYLMLTWPSQVAPANAAGRYETLTYIPLY